jgi:hydrogenase nickel incorporation protein HypA/HybF
MGALYYDKILGFERTLIFKFMHELKIIQDIFPIIENTAKKNHLKSINKVFLMVGGLRQVVLEFLQFAFKVVAEDSIAANAELIVKLIPVTACCKKCRQQFNVGENIYICPHCDSSDLEVLTGKEIVLESIEGERG